MSPPVDARRSKGLIFLHCFFAVRVDSCISITTRCGAVQILLLANHEARCGPVYRGADFVVEQATCGSCDAVPILVFLESYSIVIRRGTIVSGDCFFEYFFSRTGWCVTVSRFFYLLLWCGSEHIPCLLREKHHLTECPAKSPRHAPRIRESKKSRRVYLSWG